MGDMILDSISTPACVKDKAHSPTMENPQLVPSLLWRMTVLGYCNCRGSFCQNIQLGMKLEAPKLVSGPCKYKINIELGVKPMSSPTNLHYGQGNTVEADGSFEGSHSLGMSETIQTGIVHFDQQVAFLQQRQHILINISQFRTRQHLMNYAKVDKGCEQFIYFYELEKSGSCKYLLQLKNAIDTIDDGTIL